MSISFLASSQFVTITKLVTTSLETKKQSMFKAIQSLVTETTQQSTFETTSQFTTKITFQFKKKQTSNQEKKSKSNAHSRQSCSIL